MFHHDAMRALLCSVLAVGLANGTACAKASDANGSTGGGAAGAGGNSTASGGNGACGDFAMCGSDCVDTDTSLSHCGTCGNACASGDNATATCDAGTCGLVCDAGFDDCDMLLSTGCEADLTNDTDHCGACDTSPTESCNDADDDCDGIVDDGCPSGLGVLNGSVAGHLQYGDATGGVAFSDACSTGMAMYRVSGYIEGNIDQIRAHCALLELATDMSTVPFDYSVTRGAEETLAVYGSYVSTLFDSTCPANEFIVGISGEASTGGVHDLTIHCAEILIKGNPGAFTISHGAVTTITADGTTAGTPYVDVLTAPSVVDRYHGRSGLWLDAIGIGEASISLTFVAEESP